MHSFCLTVLSGLSVVWKKWDQKTVNVWLWQPLCALPGRPGCWPGQIQLLCFNRRSSRSFGVPGSGVWTMILHDSDLAVRPGLADFSQGGTLLWVAIGPAWPFLMLTRSFSAGATKLHRFSVKQIRELSNQKLNWGRECRGGECFSQITQQCLWIRCCRPRCFVSGFFSLCWGEIHNWVAFLCCSWIKCLERGLWSCYAGYSHRKVCAELCGVVKKVCRNVVCSYCVQWVAPLGVKVKD